MMIISEIHEKGFFWGDAKLGNFVRDLNGDLSAIDFESAGEIGKRKHVQLPTFWLRTDVALSEQQLDEAHFLVSVLHDYSSAGERCRVVDLGQLLRNYKPGEGPERWAFSRLGQVLDRVVLQKLMGV
jgi:hypothetical protein